ncbi:MAG: hypothetical protein KatS3mg001_522 [Candidatus Pacearchaeota archaeon]|nr:MAG: hypothetical protein KatS3mg001_522 [Candidatus Pacearchaeota archaeon]
MFKIEEKKGQFYLIAAVVISSLIIGISIAGNTSLKTKNTDFYDLAEEIRIESKKTIDAATSSGFQSNEIILLMENFTNNYIKKSFNRTDLYFIFGDSNNITLSGYQKEAKLVEIESGNEINTTSPGRFSISIDPQLQNLNLTIDQKPFSFEIMPGQNFYFVLIQTKNNEEYIEIG